MPLSIHGTNGITFNDGSIQASRAAVGFRNRVINGDLRVDQRNAGASQTFTAAAVLAYSVDRFYGYCTGANVTGQRVAGTAPNEFAYRFTGAASVTGIGFGTRLEATNTRDLAGSTATLSVELANSVLTTVTWTMFYANSADAFGTLASPTRTQIATGTFTVNSTLTRYSTQVSIPSAATTGLEIVFTVGAQTSGTWTIDNVQLEAGASATDFERRPYGTELALCQRYYQARNSGGAYDCGCTGQAYSTSAVYGPISLLMEMRSAPTITLAQVGNGAGQISFMNSSLSHPSTIGSIGVISISVNGFEIQGTGYTSGFTAGNASLLYRNGSGVVWRASAEL